MNQKLKILHLEDMPSDAELIAREIKKAKILSETLVVDSKADFIKALKGFSPDIILSDHSLPAFNSMEALKIVKESDLNIPFILITATVSEEFAVQTLKDGADDYILKNNLTRLPSSIEHVIKSRNAQRAEKKAKELMKAANERYRRIVETSQEGIWTVDENNRTNFVNKKMCEILGYTQEEMIGKTLFDFMDDEGKKIAAAGLERQKKKPEDSYEFKYLTKSGKEIWAIISTNAIFDENHKYVGALAMVTDITERKRSERETIKLVETLQSINKDLRQFAYIVSHNLRAPIAKIQGLSSLFVNIPGESAFNKELLENITKESLNLDNVVKDLNILITARDSEIHKKEYVLFEADVELIKQVLENEITESGATITTNFAVPGTFTVKSYLYSIIYNLISNAIKYRRKKIPLTIHIQSSIENDFICMLVKDNGLGIDLVKYGDKIFGLYKRFHGNEIPGKGIGLSLIKTQAESLGGKVEIESKVNTGSTFKIFLPKK